MERPGHTEATVDLLKMAGMNPVGVIGEIVDNTDGSMMRLPGLIELGKENGVPVITIEQMQQYIVEHKLDFVAEEMGMI